MSKASVWAEKMKAAKDAETLAWAERPEPSVAFYVPTFGSIYLAVTEEGWPEFHGLYTADNKPKPIPFADDIRNLKLVARWILNTFGEVGD